MEKNTDKKIKLKLFVIGKLDVLIWSRARFKNFPPLL